MGAGLQQIETFQDLGDVQPLCKVAFLDGTMAIGGVYHSEEMFAIWKEFTKENGLNFIQKKLYMYYPATCLKNEYCYLLVNVLALNLIHTF